MHSRLRPVRSLFAVYLLCSCIHTAIAAPEGRNTNASPCSHSGQDSRDAFAAASLIQSQSHGRIVNHPSQQQHNIDDIGLETSASTINAQSQLLSPPSYQVGGAGGGGGGYTQGLPLQQQPPVQQYPPPFNALPLAPHPPSQAFSEGVRQPGSNGGQPGEGYSYAQIQQQHNFNGHNVVNSFVPQQQQQQPQQLPHSHPQPQQLPQSHFAPQVGPQRPISHPAGPPPSQTNHGNFQPGRPVQQNGGHFAGGAFSGHQISSAGSSAQGSFSGPPSSGGGVFQAPSPPAAQHIQQHHIGHLNNGGGNFNQISSSASSVAQGSFSGHQNHGPAVVLQAQPLPQAAALQGQLGNVIRETFANTHLDPTVEKHIYVHVPPEDQEEAPAALQRLPPAPAQKHYKIIFIKAPTVQAPNYAQLAAAAAQRTEEKTLVYVLVKKPDTPSIEEIQQIQQSAIKSSKPEVYFIKYKTRKEGDLQPASPTSEYSPGIDIRLGDGSTTSDSYAVQTTNSHAGSAYGEPPLLSVPLQ